MRQNSSSRCEIHDPHRRNQNKLQRLSELILTESGLACKVSLEPNSAISSADIVITVTSAVEGVVDAHALKPGAIVCDVARPRDISKQVAESRDDVLVFEGGVVQVPGDVDFNFNFGFPPGTSYACMAETMLLALEGRYENFSLGKELSLERVREIGQLAQKHGFKLAGLRSFERALDESAILAIRDRIPQKEFQNSLDISESVVYNIAEIVKNFLRPRFRA